MPAGLGIHAEAAVAFRFGLYFPTGQGIILVVDGQYEPMGQGRQAEIPPILRFILKVPAGQRTAPLLVVPPGQ